VVENRIVLDENLCDRLKNYGAILHHDSATPALTYVGNDEALVALERHVRKARNNSLLIRGPSGVGKTATIRELARRLLNDEEEPWYILETSTTQLMADTVYLGEWQTRVRNLATDAKRSERIAVFITDIANLTGAGKSSKSDESIAAALTAFVERKEVVLIGECTPETYRTGIERHPWFKKLFTVFNAVEPDDQMVDLILRGVATGLCQDFTEEHELPTTVSDDAFRALRNFGKLYFPGTAAPGGAVRLLEHLMQELLDATGAKQSNNHQRSGGAQSLAIVHQHVVRALHSMTGVPIKLLDDSQQLSLEETRKFFESRVVGQNVAVSEVIDLITMVKAGVTDPKKPMGVLFFVGPTGVGKTETAKAMAEFLFGSADRMLRYDMSEFKEWNSYEKLIGSPNASEDSTHSGGAMLNVVRQQPFSLILLDEIEKAHANVFDLFLQLFDDGRLTDSRGRTVSFTQTIIAMTSNLGSEIQTPRGFGFKQESTSLQLENTVRESMRQFFRPELLNRIDRVVVFQPLKPEHLRAMAERELDNALARGGLTRRNVTVDIDPGVYDILTREGYNPAFGARPLKRAVERLALLPIANAIVRMPPTTEQVVLRLVPAGKKLAVKRVGPPERALKQQADEIVVRDDIRKRREKVKAADAQGECDRLLQSIEQIESLAETLGLATRKMELTEQVARHDTWKDPVAGRAARDELHYIERTLLTIDELRKASHDAVEDVLPQGKGRTPSGSALVLVRQLQRRAEIVAFSMQSDDPLHASDCFVELVEVGDPVAGDPDFVSMLADMYTNWGLSQGFSVHVINERKVSTRHTEQVTLAIEGLALYAILAREEGLHEMRVPKTAKLQQLPRYVRVRVLPMEPEVRRPLPDDELLVTHARTKGKSPRVGDFRTEMSVLHKPSHARVSAKNGLSIEQSATWLTEWLRSELVRGESLGKSTIDDNVSERPVRRYTWGPGAEVHDFRSGIVTHKLEALLKGDLDPFLPLEPLVAPDPPKKASVAGD
jgi:ATP-dependent Clp protease ATP-binding subunit ClpC